MFVSYYNKRSSVIRDADLFSVTGITQVLGNRIGGLRWKRIQMFVIGPLNHEHRDSTNTVGVLMNVTPCHCVLFPMFLRVVVPPYPGSSGLQTALRHIRGKFKGKLHPRTGYEGTRWSAPRSGLVTPGKGPVLIQEVGWAPGPVLTSHLRSIKYICDKFNTSRVSPSTSSSRRWFSLHVLPCPQHLD